MGGLGSGRWGWHRKKRAVEAARVLDLGLALRGRTPAPGQSGTFTWSRGDEVVASVGYTIRAAARGGLSLWLGYTWTPGPAGAEARSITLEIRLVAGAVPRGGRRWWGVCPLVVGGVPCGQRVCRLYLPPGATYFGCRACHRLTYRANQEHDPRVSRLVRNPDALFGMAGDPRRLPPARLGLILAALTALQRRNERERRRFEAKYGTDDA